jgi:hypothetical protein
MPDRCHTAWSDPKTYRAQLRELPSEPAFLPDALEGFVIHHAIARALGHGVPAAAEGDRNLRFVSSLLAAATARDARALTEHRGLGDYLYGTCHDFALLAASVLREHGVPARLRVGYASYVRRGCWEDHWVCEYRTGAGWSVLDAQLGARARAGLRIVFDVTDLPETAWRPAASIWRGIRSGAIDPATCGVSFANISGAWFVAAAVLRDAAAMAGIECLPWDYWGPGRSICAAHAVTDEQAHEIDALAAALEPAPADRPAANAILTRFPWARPTPTILSFPEGRQGVEIAVAP